MTIRHDNTPPIGTVFGSLTVIGQDWLKLPSGSLRRVWLCDCSCGTRVNRQPSDLRNGKYLKCRKCNRVSVEIGAKYGRFTATGRVCGGVGGAIWQMTCECGTVEEWITCRIHQTKNPMCGSCAASGLYKPPSRAVRKRDQLWERWRSLIGRCYLTSHTSYPHYGAKGVTVCQEWHEFEAFEKWALANGYARHLELDRIKEDGDYNPGNCHFIPKRANVEKMLAKHKAASTGVYGGAHVAR